MWRKQPIYKKKKHVVYAPAIVLAPKNQVPNAVHKLENNLNRSKERVVHLFFQLIAMNLSWLVSTL